MIALVIMLNDDDLFFSAERFFNESRKRIAAMNDLYKKFNNGVERKSIHENKSALTIVQMLQNSRNNMEKLQELSKRLRRLE